MLAVVIGFMLVFRATLSYNRYWDGRFRIGGVVKTCRDFGRQVQYNVPAGNPEETYEKQEVLRLILLFFVLLVQHLREEQNLDACDPWITERERKIITNQPRKPLAIIFMINKKIIKFVRSNRIHVVQYQHLEDSLSDLTAGFNGTDAIRFTPFPFPFAQTLTIFLVLYCFTAPFVLYPFIGKFTPIGAYVLALAFFGIYEISLELEDPFGHDANDLNLDDMATALQKDFDVLRFVDTSYETYPPAPLEPVAFSQEAFQTKPSVANYKASVSKYPASLLPPEERSYTLGIASQPPDGRRKATRGSGCTVM
eukprot:CAMPEP_0196653904 /NCGR_PEP_ID=MMETSP1086-20130531/3565_1 /TAXON_ID=77921 /ORGANISM="Cyanoptyche  gloeocystis , Strain SAG4.97" /LENGTH=309 /DNA_ID=CAMNT_0041985339 /DNA_START=221 /DNA_END=1150 /DNA_ORIENTATION=+